MQVNEDENKKYHAGEHNASLKKGQNINMVAEEAKYLAEMEEQPVKCRQVSFHCPQSWTSSTAQRRRWDPVEKNQEEIHKCMNTGVENPKM